MFDKGSLINYMWPELSVSLTKSPQKPSAGNQFSKHPTKQTFSEILYGI